MIAKVNGEWNRVKNLRLQNGASVPSEIVEDVSLMSSDPDFIQKDSDVDKGTQVSRALNEYKILRFNYKRTKLGDMVPAHLAGCMIDHAERIIKLLGGRI